jgi:hypothetical protein
VTPSRRLSTRQRALIYAFAGRRPTFSDATINGALRRAAASAASPLSHYEYDRVRVDGDPTWIRIIQRRGTWRKALVEAGLPCDGRRGPTSQFDLDDCIGAVHRAADAVADEPLTYRRYEEVAKELELPSGQTVRNKLGRWSNALEIAGFRRCQQRGRAAVGKAWATVKCWHRSSVHAILTRTTSA